MSNISLTVGDDARPLAAQAVVEAFFATVSYRLEPDGWSSRFPVVLNRLYSSRFEPQDVDAALQELDIIERELKTLPPERAIASLRNLARLDDAQLTVNRGAANLLEYFTAADGKTPILQQLRQAVLTARQNQQPVKMSVSSSLQSRAKTLLIGLFAPVFGIGGIAYNRHLAVNYNYFYIKLAILAPLFVVLGLAVSIAPSLLGNQTDSVRPTVRGEMSKANKAVWVVLVVLTAAAAAANFYWLDSLIDDQPPVNWLRRY